ncbi:Uncharacterized protein HZ326_10353 [Fusarium oxysporum f. sp. albedinis]|nr:Uncharacterized protein HZ326_10353 [Fusarium oxysporum f. sp. albedinis]
MCLTYYSEQWYNVAGASLNQSPISEVIDDVKNSLIAVAELSQSFILDAKLNLKSRYRCVSCAVATLSLSDIVTDGSWFENGCYAVCLTSKIT